MAQPTSRGDTSTTKSSRALEDTASGKLPWRRSCSPSELHWCLQMAKRQILSPLSGSLPLTDWQEGSPVTALRCRPLPLQIATKVELYVGNLPPGSKDPEQCIMKRLGYLSFDNNERSGHQARELKSVHVSTPAFLLKLVVQRCHTNRLNIYNQVPTNPLLLKSCCFRDAAACHHNKLLAAYIKQLQQRHRHKRQRARGRASSRDRAQCTVAEAATMKQQG